MDSTLIKRILRGKKPKTADLVYLFAQTRENEKSVLLEAARLANQFPKSKIGVCADGGEVYGGQKNWAEELKREGIWEERIFPIQSANDLFPPSTSAEAAGVIRSAKEKGWKDVIVVAAPFHQLRAFITTVSVTINMKADIRVWSHTGAPEDWDEVGVHTQSTPPMTRKEQLKSELEKLQRYHEEGSIVPPEEIEKYLNKRDNASEKKV